MFQGLLRYLGLDQETKRVRREAQINLERASVELSQLQNRFAAASRTSDSGRAALTRALRDSEFNIGKRRAAGSGI